MVDATTQHAAKNSSFRLPMRLLPRQKREDLLALYAYCRALDDAVDESPDAATALKQLAFWEQETAVLLAGGKLTHPVMLALQDVHQRVGFNADDMRDMLAAMRMDAEEHMLYPTLAELEQYCHGVASCVGLMSMRVFGADNTHARPFALHLGHALQLTNIWRDVVVDAGKNRVYIAREWIKDAYPSPEELRHNPQLLAASYGELAETAQKHYNLAAYHAQYLPTRAIAPALAMRDVYQLYWKKLNTAGGIPPMQGKIVLGKRSKCSLVLRASAYMLSNSPRRAES